MRGAAVKVMAMLWKQEHLTAEQFRDYYETYHAPLARRLFPMIGDYRRNFVDRELTVWPEGESAPDYDVVNELCFETEEDYEAFKREFAKPEVLAQVRADEANFLQTPKTRRLVVREYISPRNK